MYDGCPDCCALDILTGKARLGAYCAGCAQARYYQYQNDPAQESIVACACVIPKRGLRFFGKRHKDCFATMPHSIPRIERAAAEQGFLTSRDRFVDRKTAAFIALAAGQIKGKLITPSTWLTSEDLW